MLAIIIDCLMQGGVIVYPTDTAYGLGADWTNARAVKKVFAVKQRSPDKKVPVIVSGVAMAKKYVTWNAQAQGLVDHYWPGALTIVLPKENGTTLGVRMPNHPIALQIVRAFGKPIVSTSANISYQPTCYSIRSFVGQLSFVNGHVPAVSPDIVIDAGALARRMPSTVVDCSGQSMRVLRSGRLSKLIASSF